MAKKSWNWTNNKLKNAIREAGWDKIGDFCKDFNIQASTFQNWTGGKLPGIFDSRINPFMVSELCKIFDCSKEELNNMVYNAYRIKHGHPEEEPERVPIGDKDATFARYLAYDEKKKEENSNGEIPLEDFLEENKGIKVLTDFTGKVDEVLVDKFNAEVKKSTSENPDFFNEYPEIKAEVEDGKTVEEVAEGHNIPTTVIRPITKPTDEYIWEQEPEVMRKKEIEVKMSEAKENTESFKLSPEEYALIEETMYGKISYRKFKRLMNCIKYYCM